MQELLAHSDFVRSLARQLIGTADADDLVQDTWLRALGRVATVRAPRNWLIQVLKRLAANHRRSEQRRQRRELDAVRDQPTEGPSTTEILACEEARGRVVAAVLDLEEPFRATVLARFYECLDTEQIAARERVAIATVRSRLKRGLDRLRARLDAEHGGLRAAWAGPLSLLGKGQTSLPIPVAGALMSIAKKVSAAALLLLAGVSLWLLSSRAPEALAPGVTAKAAPGTAESGDHRSTPRSDELQRTAAADSAASRGRVPEPLPYPITDEPIDEVSVRVMDATTRQPVADAEVVYLPFRIDYEHERTRGDRALHELGDQLRERYGTRTKTGADGLAAIHLPRSGGHVLALHADKSNDVYIAPCELPPDQRPTLWLEDSRVVRIRLVDASGGPVAGGLIDVSSLGSSPVVPGSAGYESMGGPSDQDGMIRVLWRRDREGLSVRPWIVGPSELLHLDLPAALDRVTELRYPATGSLTIELRTPSGQLWPTPIHASAHSLGADRSTNPNAGPITWCRAEPGSYRIAHVETGLSFRVTASPDGLSTHPMLQASAVVSGPTRTDEEVRAVLTLAQEPCLLSATLQLGNGSPLPARCQVHISREGGAVTWLWHLPPDGRVGWYSPEGRSAHGRIQVIDQSPHAAQYECEWSLAAPAGPGVHDLGNLIVEEPATVVAGHIDVGDASWQGPGLHLFIEAPHEDGSWSSLQELTISPATTTAFAIRARTEARRVRVSIRSARHFVAPAPVVVAVGTSDLRLRVERGVPMRARVLAPTSYAQAIACRAVREDGREPPKLDPQLHDDSPCDEATLIDFDGGAATFSWPALPAGSYRIEVSAHGVAKPLATIASVRLASDALADPRLDPIDVRSSGRTLTVRVRPGVDGPRPLTDGGVVWRPTGQPGQGWNGLLFDAAGEARLLVGPDAVDITVAVPGFRLREARAVVESTVEATLEPCLEIPFQLAPAVAERFTGYRIRIELEPKSPTGTESEPVRFWRAGERDPAIETSRSWLQRLAGSGECTLDVTPNTHGAIPVSGPGAFQLSLTVLGPNQRIPVNESWLHWQRSPLVPAETVVHGEGNAPLVIDVDEAVSAKVLEALRQRR